MYIRFAFVASTAIQTFVLASGVGLEQQTHRQVTFTVSENNYIRIYEDDT